MISFDNTEIAFASKSDKDLQWSYRLFKMIEKPWMVKLGKWMTKIAFALHLPVKGVIRRTIFKQFCGGEFIKDCEDKIEQLHKYGVGTILDYSVEGKTSDEDLDRTRDEIIKTIHKARDTEAIPFSVFKPTGIARVDILERANDPNTVLSESDRNHIAAVEARIESICRAAYDAGVPLFIDAEDSWYQDIIDRMVNKMMARFNKEKVFVYNTLQMYRHDRLDFLKTTYLEGMDGGYKVGIKLVRGAYMEKERERAEEMDYEDPIQPNKEATDRDYDLALTFMVEHIEHFAICAGTHNEKSSEHLVKLMADFKIAKDDSRVYFAQLLGMSDHISFNLAHAGYNVAKYVPYGPIKEVMPYLIRRAEENTSVAGQMGRELGLIIKEKKRRKTSKA